MPLTRLDIRGFRNLANISLELAPWGFHYFYGKNGSGKTSLIESVYYMIRGRSFRTNNFRNLITNNLYQFSISSQFMLGSHVPSFPLIVKKNLNGIIEISAGSQELTSFSSIIRQFPVLLVHSGSHQLLEAGPAFRRKYLDWGSFHLDINFMKVWKRYTRALRQRNILLRTKSYGAELEAWTHELIKSGLDLDRSRQSFIKSLLPCLEYALSKLLVLDDIKISYQSGWPKNSTLDEALLNTSNKERLLCCTQVGPHRADFNLLINKMLVKQWLSRGQQKLFIYAMIASLGALINGDLDVYPIYLLDDFAAELDLESRTKLLALLREQKAQVFFTGIDLSVPEVEELKMFHVEHGEIYEKA